MGYAVSFRTYVPPRLFVRLPDGVCCILLYLCYGVLYPACGMPPISMDGVAVRPNAQRQLSAAPLATSTGRHERWCATKPKDRAQLRGRASGVRCKAMLGGIVEFDYKFTIASIDLLNIALASSILGGVIFGNNISVKVSSPVKSKPESPVKAPFKFITLDPFS